jgi:large subunit ribosomal protein L9
MVEENSMKVILQREVPKLGKLGEIVNVADGYARNYLFPRQLAVTAKGGALKEHEARAAREKERGTKNLESAQAGASKLEGLTLTLIAKVGSGTKLYGSITSQDVADEIAKKSGVTIDKRRVGLVDPIKTLGTYTIPVRLHSDVAVPIIVEVMTEDQIERRKVEMAAAEAAAAAAPPPPEVETPEEPALQAEAAPAAEAMAEPAAEELAAAEASPVDESAVEEGVHAESAPESSADTVSDAVEESAGEEAAPAEESNE